jgi:hypothetical protein
VREHIAENVCSLAPVIGREPAISELLPLVKLFFADEQDGTASIEIRRKVLRSVAPLVETLGAEACGQHLMPEVCVHQQCISLPCAARRRGVAARHGIGLFGAHA